MTAPRPRHILPVIVLSQFAGTSLWFSGNVVLPDLARDLSLSGHSLGGVTTAVQLGVIAGTLVFALFNVADRWRARDVFLACALLGALSNAALLLMPRVPGDPWPALLALRLATGFFLAGIYPVGMKIAASWYREGLGMALGWLLAALVMGTALPHLLKGVLPGGLWDEVVLGVSLLAAAGGLLMHALVPAGPYLAPAPRFEPLAALRAFGSREFRASALGYFGHCWEVYAMWVFAPPLLAAYAAQRALALDISLWSFWVIAAGAAGCVAGGLVSRRSGSGPVAVSYLVVSGLCCLLLPLAFTWPPPAFLAFMLVWGVAVAGDSPQFSALNAGTAPRAFVGSALTLANCAGFALSVASLQLMEALTQHVAAPYWFLPIALGPALGLVACARLARRIRTPSSP